MDHYQQPLNLGNTDNVNQLMVDKIFIIIQKE